nr:glycosyltransferase family A protein [Companilactobacillus insicii]
MVKNKLSIIMTTYNVASYVVSTLDSLVAQTNKNFELVVVDDCSTDSTLDIIANYEDKYDWISSYSHTNNSGVSAARNTGLQHISGNLVTFIDGDDWLEPGYVDFFLTVYENTDVDLATCGFFIDTENGKSRVKSDKRQNKFADRDEAIKQITKISGTVMGYTWNKVYRRSVIEENSIHFQTDLDLMEDQVFNVEYATVAKTFYLDNIPLYHYVSRKDSITRKFAMENVRDVGVANLRVYKTIRDSRADKDGREQIE